MADESKLFTLQLSQEQISTLRDVFDDAKRITIMQNERDKHKNYTTLYSNIYLQVAGAKTVKIHRSMV
ncbi:MAG: hypothetical protein PHX80_05330 [Candidatus Nanoarchaeia archaeon]|nr:hypothetical protein [Candidatus Nanoarchaeia archaeon]